MKTDRMILGENAIYSTDCEKTGLNNNVIVCGSSGSGKTMSVSEPRLLETYNSSLIATVTKRRIVNKYKSIFELRGYEVEDLNFSNPEKSTVSYDPIRYVKTTQDIRYLAESIVMASVQQYGAGRNVDTYWYDSGTSLLAAEIARVLMDGDDVSFNDVLDLHEQLRIKDGKKDGYIETTLDSYFENMPETELSRFTRNCWDSFREVAPRTARCIYGMVNTALDATFVPDIKRMMAMPRQLDFERIAQKKTMLFVSTSAVNPALHHFVNIFYSQVFKSLFEYGETLPGGKLPIPVHVLCDDFATGGRVHNFAEYISIFREKQISVTLLLQSESQLEGMYGPADATTIINNCDTYLYLGGMDLQTANSISIRLNEPLDEVLYMPVGTEYIFRRGQQPLVTTRYNIMADEEYQAITEAYEADMGEGGR